MQFFGGSRDGVFSGDAGEILVEVTETRAHHLVHGGSVFPSLADPRFANISPKLYPSHHQVLAQAMSELT